MLEKHGSSLDEASQVKIVSRYSESKNILLALDAAGLEISSRVWLELMWLYPMSRTRDPQTQEDPILKLHRQRLRVPHDVDYNLCQNKTLTAGWHIGKVWLFSIEVFQGYRFKGEEVQLHLCEKHKISINDYLRAGQNWSELVAIIGPLVEPKQLEYGRLALT